MKQPKDCTDIYKEGMHENGEYSIFIKGKHHQVLCDMDTGAFGYTVIQKRRNGKISFARNWFEYKNGFGNFEDGFWIGNELIHFLTEGNIKNEVRVEMKHNGINYFAVYENFNVASESEKHKLTMMVRISRHATEIAILRQGTAQMRKVDSGIKTVNLLI